MFFSTGTGSQSSRTEKCSTKYPIVLAHGMGFQAKIMGVIDYWGAIPRTLENNGADIHVTTVNAMDSHAKKGASWKEQVLGVLKKTGAPKVNVVGHSDGCLYSRHAITHLGLAPYVASHTSLSGPHHGSTAADVFMRSIPEALRPVVGGELDWMSALAMGDVKPDSMENGRELTRAYMNATFNPSTPDMSGVFYQSYGFKVTNAAGAGFLAPSWMAILPEEGDNDGLVSVASARWGEFRGVLDGGVWSFLGGVNHFAIVGLTPVAPPGYDPNACFVGLASGLREMGF